MTAAWGAVVPVKLLALAKSRLGAYGGVARAELALAFADDVVCAVLPCADILRVVVVTDDVRAGDVLRRPGVCVVRDLPGAGLNAALAHGADLLRAAEPGLGVVALASDLPALRTEDLADALLRVVGRGFVTDTQGVGTTLLAASPGSTLLPSYGPASRLRHLDSGAIELTAAPGLRRDVDTPEDLRAALLLGVGARTAAVAAGLIAVLR